MRQDKIEGRGLAGVDGEIHLYISDACETADGDVWLTDGDV